MRTLWPIGSVSDETLLLSLVRSSLAVPQAAERAKTFETNPTHLRYMRGLIGVLQRVTISLLSRVRLFTPLQGGPAFLLPYSPECVEGEFSEVGLPLYGVLGSSA
jgi:hypothetical protein